MANTYVDYTAVASQTDYNFSFEYLRDEHVKVKVNDVIVTNYTIVTSPVQLIRFNTAPTAGATIKIYRDSRGDFSPLVDFVNGSVLTESELDESYKHNLFVSQESSEGTGGEQLTKKGLTNYDAEDNKIINLGSPTTATDAATKSYVDQTIDNAIALGGSPAIVSLGGYDVTSAVTNITQSLANWTNTNALDVTATGSTTARSLANRFADVVNVLDYGATGDGVTDDTTAIQNALNNGANKVVYIPSGTYVIDSDGLNIPSSNITIEGSAQTFLKSTNQYYNGGTTPPTVGQGNVINATSVDNITIKNISIIGSYDPAWGNAYVYSNLLPNMTDGKKLLFLDQCDKITLDNFTITNGYASSTLFTSPEDRVQSIYGYAQVGISRGDDIRLINCNHINSSSEAWSIYDCTNVLVDGCIYDTNYGVSYLDITYCTDVIVTNCQFMKRLISDAGELLNLASSRLTVDSNKFLNGNCDIGNEYLNADLTIGASFLLHDQTVSNNTLYNGIISCSTAGTGTYTPTWSQENVIISNNTITIDVDTRPAASGSTALDYTGISLPRYRNSRNFLITGNSILLKGAMQTTGANPRLYNTIALIDFKLATTGLLRENFSITNNRLMTDITSYDSDDINNSSGAIIFKYGNWENLAIENNYIDAPVGIYIESHESIDRLSVSGNKIYGESAIVFPFTSATNTDISDLTIADNTFEFWNTSGHTYTSADFIIKGFGFFLTASIGTTSSTMPNTVIKNNVVKCVGLAYISNATASTSIILDLTLDNNDVDFIDYLAKDAGFSVEHLRLGRANSNIEDSTIRLTDNYFVDTTASGLDFNLFAMDKVDFINNVWEGVIALDVEAQHSLGSITDSRYVKKNNMAFGTLTATYNANLGTAVTIIDDGNSGGF